MGSLDAGDEDFVGDAAIDATTLFDDAVVGRWVDLDSMEDDDGPYDEPLGWVDLVGGVLTLSFLVSAFTFLTLLCSLSPWIMGLSAVSHVDVMYWLIAPTTLLMIVLFGVFGVGVWRISSENRHLRVFSVIQLSCVSVSFMSWTVACCVFW